MFWNLSVTVSVKLCKGTRATIRNVKREQVQQQGYRRVVDNYLRIGSYLIIGHIVDGLVMPGGRLREYICRAPQGNPNVSTRHNLVFPRRLRMVQMVGDVVEFRECPQLGGIQGSDNICIPSAE